MSEKINKLLKAFGILVLCLSIGACGGGGGNGNTGTEAATTTVVDGTVVSTDALVALGRLFYTPTQISPSLLGNHVHHVTI